MKNILLLLCFIAFSSYAQTGEAYYRMGIQFENSANFSEAITYYNKANKAGFNEADLFLRRGICFLIVEEPQKAYDDFDTSVKMKPYNMEYLYFRGCANKELGDLDGAISDYEKVIAEDEFEFKSLLALGSIYYLEIKDYKKAIPYFETYLEIKEDDVDVMSFLSACYWHLHTDEGTKKGIAVLTKALEIKPEDSFNYFSRGMLYVNLRDFDNALKDLNKAIELDPDYVDAYFESAMVYLQKKEYDKQIASCTKAIALKGNVGEYYFCRGLGYMAKEDKTKACEDFTEALALGYDTARGHKKIACK